MRRSNILILGGTEDARQQADVLAGLNYQVIYSLAGVTRTPTLPQHSNVEFHSGGFGGLNGLEPWTQYFKDYPSF